MKKYRKLDGEFNMELVPTKMLKGISKAQKCNFKSPAIGIGIDDHPCGIIWKHPCGEWVLTALCSLTADTIKKCLIIMSAPEQTIELIKEHKKSEK